jgi:hypothetical protein
MCAPVLCLIVRLVLAPPPFHTHTHTHTGFIDEAKLHSSLRRLLKRDLVQTVKVRSGLGAAHVRVRALG